MPELLKYGEWIFLVVIRRAWLLKPLFLQYFDHSQDQRYGDVLHLRTQIYKIHPIIVELPEACLVIDLLMKYHHSIAIEPILKVNLGVKIELFETFLSMIRVFLDLLIQVDEFGTHPAFKAFIKSLEVKRLL